MPNPATDQAAQGHPVGIADHSRLAIPTRPATTRTSPPAISHRGPRRAMARA